MQIDTFQSDLSTLNPRQVACKYYLAGPCHVLGDDRYFDLKDQVASHFGVEFNEIILVGSAKVGFSIAPTKRYRPFGEESDIDIAVVSQKLFTEVWKEAYAYRKSGAYWPRASSFFKYLSMGWIRPDTLPTSDSFTFTSKWWDFFNDMTASEDFGPYKIRAGLYHSWFFFFEYQVRCIEKCLERM